LEKPTQMSRSKGLREGSETNQSPRTPPCGTAADICDSLASKQQPSRISCRPMLLVAGALIVTGLLVLIIGGYFELASGVVCENNPDCVPGWWLPSVVAIATLLVGCGIVIGWRRRR
jgi:heme A synthase